MIPATAAIPVTAVTPDGMVPARPGAEPFEIVRAQETELPQALKWQLGRSDEDYDPAVVEACAQMRDDLEKE